jgi:hypothetical protein
LLWALERPEVLEDMNSQKKKASSSTGRQCRSQRKIVLGIGGKKPWHNDGKVDELWSRKKFWVSLA